MKFVTSYSKNHASSVISDSRSDFFYFSSKKSLKSFLSFLEIFSSGLNRTGAYVSELTVLGVGFKFMFFSQKVLQISLGYSHDIYVFLPAEVSFHIFKTYLSLFSYNKVFASQTASIIRSLRFPDSYKGKGIRYLGEIVSLKKGKQKQR